MPEIKKVAVLGSDVIGSGIAAQVANAGYKVVLLDNIPKDAANRNMLAENAVRNQLAKPSGFVHKSKAALVTTGNLEDNLDLLKDCDLIIEAMTEGPKVKQEVYRKIDAVRKPGSVVSSNTPLPMHVLTAGMPEGFARDFMITHFSNPPRSTQLLEVVPGTQTRSDAVKDVCRFADVSLGKSVVMCNDTPGLIADRIGGYWMMLGLQEAMNRSIPVEQADAVMGKSCGIPKTGIFGLLDLVGIDLMQFAGKAMRSALPAQDPYLNLANENSLVSKMVAEGYTGRRGKGGFYRLNAQGGKKTMEVLDLTSRDELRYRPQDSGLASVNAAGEQYAWAVLSGTLCYAASLVPEVSSDISAVDTAMRKGYNWKKGPFEMIDEMGVDQFCDKLKQEGKDVPAFLEKARGKKLYTVEDGKRMALGVDGNYAPIVAPEGTLMLEDIKLHSTPLAQNKAAALWDLGDGIACLEFRSKRHAITPDTLQMIEESTRIVKDRFKGLVIANDTDIFSTCVDLELIRTAVKVEDWNQVGDIIKRGQAAMMGLKYAPFPVVSALSGLAIGGGCEILLHSDAVQAHVESYPGLTQPGVGLIPTLGGCTQMLLRHTDDKAPGVADVPKVFATLLQGKVAGSAEEAREMKFLRPGDGISMNRARVLPDAKARCLALAKDYTPPTPPMLKLPGETAAKFMVKAAMGGAAMMGLQVTDYDRVIADALAGVLTGSKIDTSKPVSEQQVLDLEYEAAMALAKDPRTFARIEHMLQTGKPLRESTTTPAVAVVHRIH